MKGTLRVFLAIGEAYSGLALTTGGIATLLPSAAFVPSGAVAAEFPTCEVMGFPISPHQFVAVQTAHVQERSRTPTLTLGGIPASLHQIMVLTPRSEITEQTVVEKPTKADSSALE
jgi:hypothetical protein